jgi:glycosyltransferase involved in cell wall biosynthesis
LKGKPKKKVVHLGMGTSIHVQRWVNEFAKRGWDVAFITFENPKNAEFHPNVNLHVMNRENIPWLGYILNSSKISKLIKVIDPDLVHAHSVDAYGIYALLAKQLPVPKPVVITAWGFYHIKMHKWFKRSYEKKALSYADMITTQDRGLMQSLAEGFSIPKEKFRVFHWGIDLTRFKKGYEKEVSELRKKLDIKEYVPIVMSTRELMPHYNIPSIIMSISDVKKKYPDCVFVFLKGPGDDNYLEKMKNLTDKLGVRDSTRFVDKFLSYKDIPFYLNLATVVIMLPYTDQASMSLTESLACGNIILASDLKGNREWIEDAKNGFLVKVVKPKELDIHEVLRGVNITDSEERMAENSISSKELSKKIIMCLDSQREKEEMAKINRKLVEERANWESGAGQMEDIYLGLVGNRKNQ